MAAPGPRERIILTAEILHAIGAHQGLGPDAPAGSGRSGADGRRRAGDLAGAAPGTPARAPGARSALPRLARAGYRAGAVDAAGDRAPRRRPGDLVQRGLGAVAERPPAALGGAGRSRISARG